MVSQNIALKFYVIFLSVFIVCSIYMLNLQKKSQSLSKVAELLNRNRFCFLTGWNFTLQIIFMQIAILDELAGIYNVKYEVKRFLGRLRSYLFSSLVFPVGCCVAFTFWTIFSYDRELVFPRKLDEFFPLWLNHVIHSSIMLPILLELNVAKKQSFINFRTAMKPYTLLSLIYNVVFFWRCFQEGVWLYPVFSNLNWFQRICLCLTIYFSSLVYMKIGLLIQARKKPKTTIKSK